MSRCDLCAQRAPLDTEGLCEACRSFTDMQADDERRCIEVAKMLVELAGPCPEPKP